jgi:hypothetical protein
MNEKAIQSSGRDDTVLLECQHSSAETALRYTKYPGGEKKVDYGMVWKGRNQIKDDSSL